MKCSCPIGFDHCYTLVDFYLFCEQYSPWCVPSHWLHVSMFRSQSLLWFFYFLVLTFQTMVIVQYTQTVKLETEGERVGWSCIEDCFLSMREIFRVVKGRFKSIGLVASLWLLTIALLIYISTLIPDFYRIKIMSPKIFLTNDVVDDRTNNLLTTSISM